jgi:DNA repair photolyase
MRWDNLLIERTGEERASLPLFANEAVVRHIDTPQFRGITFYEVDARSILNHVPGDRFGFNWTLNLYRGCTHACVYCLAGDTPILMGDGRTKPLADVRVGDAVYGTVRDGIYRRYAVTRVLDHWSTMKPAYQLTLEDDTQLVASGDHRFLTRRGWKHVTGFQQGGSRRPHLTANNELLGSGGFAPAPEKCSEYRQGYLCGLIPGDGHLGSYSYVRPGRGHGVVHRFRLALTDLEAVRRARAYLEGIGVGSDEFLFQEAVGARKAMYGIRNSSATGVAAVESAIRWPDSPSAAWRKGYLAGIFDAEGSYSRGILRIANTDREIIDRVASCLRRFGFSFAEEKRDRDNGLTYVRVLGGLREHLRFFHTVDPAISRKRTIEGRAIKFSGSLRVRSIEPLGVDLPLFDITTGTGDFIANGVVSHNCFARPTHSYLDFNAGRDFETRIVVKVNAVELLRRELRRPSWSGELIAMGTNTDPYQRAEGHYRLMRGVLSVLNEARNPYSILTKGTLIRRDIDLLQEGAAHMGVTANFSVGTVDERVWRETEPGTPHPLKRLEAVRQLNQAGIPCGVLMAPILPGISDAPEQLEATVRAAAEAGATHITPITLHLRPGVKQEFLPWLTTHYPDLLVPYGELYRRSEAPAPVRQRVAQEVGHLRRKFGASEPGPTGGRGRRRREERPAQTRTSPRSEKPPAPEAPDPPPAGNPGQPGQLSFDLETQACRRPQWAPAVRQALRRPPGAGG